MDISIVTGGEDKTIKIWSVKNGICGKTLKGHTDYIVCMIQMKWSKDNCTIITGSCDKTW